MIVPKTFNGNCYLITNFSNSNNPIFTAEEEINNFKERIEEKLKDLVEILAWSFHVDHYQMVFSIKSRESFENFYKEKHESPELESTDIPATYLILSQEMANIQSGYAKWFNFRHRRYVSLFGRRYTKVLLEHKWEVEEAVYKVNEGIKFWDFEEIWSYIWNFLKDMLNEKRLLDTSAGMYGGVGEVENCWFSGFLSYLKWDLRGNYIPTPAHHHFQ